MSPTDLPPEEYGLRFADGTVQWPDLDGDIPTPGLGYVLAEDAGSPEGLKAALRAKGVTGAAILERSREYRVLRDPLPTTPGALVRASIEGRHNRVIVALTNDGDSIPWITLTGSADWFAAADLSDVEVLFDPSAP